VITGAKTPSPEIEALIRDKQVVFAETDLADPGGPARLVAMAKDRVDLRVPVKASLRCPARACVTRLKFRVRRHLAAKRTRSLSNLDKVHQERSR
jgi:hypothetical protein